MTLSKGFIFAAVIVGFVLVANVHCAPGNIEPESIPIRVRRQLPSIPSGIPSPGIPSIPGLPSASGFKNAGSFAKSIPGFDSMPSGVPRLARSISETAAAIFDIMMTRMKRDARGTGNLPTKTG